VGEHNHVITSSSVGESGGVRPDTGLMTKNDMPRLVSIRHAADELGCDPRTIRRYIAAGLLTASRVGPRMIRVERDSLLALLRPVGGAR
jgi:excisionase family DNA binding protein